VEISGEGNLEKSRDYFEQAIEKDPGYALAWAGLADAYSWLASWNVVPRQEAAPRARAAAEKALELDSSQVGPLMTLAETKMNYEWDWAGTERLCKRAIEMSPNCGYAHHVYATYLAEVGRVQEAVTEAKKAHDVEPLSDVFGANVVWKLYLPGVMMKPSRNSANKPLGGLLLVITLWHRCTYKPDERRKPWRNCGQAPPDRSPAH